MPNQCAGVDAGCEVPFAFGPAPLITTVSSGMAILLRSLGAAGAFIGVYVIRYFFGTAASIVVLATLLSGWWLLHLYTEIAGPALRPIPAPR